MLPERAGTLLLSKDSREKLDSYYYQFCGDSDFPGHIIYACHASFPLILSPTLANLIWLNFNCCYPKGIPKTVERVAVSDFLLSPLVKQIGHRQYEVIPEIRSYLLYLLQDNRWFTRRGIEEFGTVRLVSLANFLESYLLDKSSKIERSTTGFHELNKWASLAYLDPERLTYEMAKSLQETFKVDDGGRVNEYGQLRLNGLMNQFSQQLDLKIHDKDGTGIQDFMNLKNISNANKALLFGREDEASERLIRLDNAVSNGVDATSLSISIPLPSKISSRINRKKNDVQKIYSIIIGIDNYRSRPLSGAKFAAQSFRSVIAQLNSDRSYDINDINLLLDEFATKLNISQTITATWDAANEEDIILIYFSGHGSPENDSSAIITADYSGGTIDETNSFTNTSFKALIKSLKQGKNCQVVLLLDTMINGRNLWVEETDIQISATAEKETQSESTIDGKPNTIFNSTLVKILEQTKAQITYRDLFNYLSYKIKLTNSRQSETPCLLTSPNNLDAYFLTKRRKDKVKDSFLMFFDNGSKAWHIVPEDFVQLKRNSLAEVFEYSTNHAINSVRGEISVGRGFYQFGGTTERLNNEVLYKVSPQKSPLSLIANKEIYTLLSNALSDEFSNWGKFKMSDENNSFSNKLRVLTNRKDEHELFYSGQEPSGPSFSGSIFHKRWSVKGNDQLVSLVKRLSRYEYFNQLSNFDPYEESDATFRVQVKIETKNSGEVDRANPIQKNWLLDESSFFIENGIVRFKPILINIFSYDNSPLFCDIYLTTSDLLIKRISNGNRLMPSQTIDIECREYVVFEQMFMDNTSASIKLLMSRNPITVDFTQSGTT